MADILNYDFKATHITDVDDTLERLIASGGGDIEVRPLQIDHPQDHLDHLCDLFLSFWGHSCPEEPADNYTYRMTCRGVTVHSQVFVLPIRKKCADRGEYKDKLYRALYAIRTNILKFTKCHLYEGKLQFRYASRYNNMEACENGESND